MPLSSPAAPAPAVRRTVLGIALTALSVWLAACGAGHSHVPASSTRSSVVITLVGAGSPAAPSAAAPRPAPPASPTPAAVQLCLVSPSRGIPETYVPPDLVTLPQSPFVGPAVLMRRDAAAALQQLLAGAAQQHIYLEAVSGYRSADLQRQTLEAEIKQYGPARAYSEVALPGHSEHQLGDAVDVLSQRDPVDMDDSFGTTPEGKWLAANSPAYGFVLSYPQGKEAITGYIYEPWHIRYVGLPLAQEIAASGETLTEYLPQHGMDGCPLQNASTVVLGATPTPGAP